MSDFKKVAFVFAGQLSNVILSFIIIYFLSRRLSFSENGTYGQVYFMTDILYAIASVGIANSLFIFYSRYTEQLHYIFKHVLILAILLGIGGAFLGILFAYPITSLFQNRHFAPIFIIYSPVVILTFVNNIINLTLNFLGKFKIAISISLFSAVLKFILILFAIKLSFFQLSFIFIIILVVSFITAVVGLYICKTQGLLKDFNFNLSKKLINDIIYVSYPMGASNLLGISYSYVSGILISSILFQEQYAIYRNGAIELPFIGIISSAITTIYLPQISRLAVDNNVAEIIKTKKMLIDQVITFAFPIITFFLFFSDKLIVLLLSEKYRASIPIFIVFVAMSYIRITDYQDVLLSAKKSKIIMYSNIIFIVSNIVFSFIGIKILGAVGAAIGVFVSVFILAAFLLYFTCLHLNIRIRDLVNFKKIFIILLTSSIFCLPSSFLPLNVSYILIYFMCYTVLVYFALYKLQIIDKQIVELTLSRFRKNK